jgi:hypothetical protein
MARTRESACDRRSTSRDEYGGWNRQIHQGMSPGSGFLGAKSNDSFEDPALRVPHQRPVSVSTRCTSVLGLMRASGDLQPKTISTMENDHGDGLRRGGRRARFEHSGRPTKDTGTAQLMMDKLWRSSNSINRARDRLQ